MTTYSVVVTTTKVTARRRPEVEHPGQSLSLEQAERLRNILRSSLLSRGWIPDNEDPFQLFRDSIAKRIMIQQP
jgi:hypothetical protein